MPWTHIDNQLRKFAPYLRDEFGITPPESNSLATTIATEIEAISEDWQAILAADAIPASRRLEELQAFQMFGDIVASSEVHPSVVRAQVVYQNYLSLP